MSEAELLALERFAMSIQAAREAKRWKRRSERCRKRGYEPGSISEAR
jgi:hypothetical protein